MISGLIIIEKELCEQITNELNKIRLLYRIFSRTKDKRSIEEKIDRKKKENKPYKINNKLMQDIIGIRIVTYFKDDINIVYSILKEKLNFFSEEIDEHELTVFKPKRTNIICKFNKNHTKIFNQVQKSMNDENFILIENTFELQLRTILSEGWHEIDHNLRYKCKEIWSNHKESERMLNGIYASLETNDITLKSLFNELAYKHYKNKNWEGLIRNKFRLNFQQITLKKDLIDILDENKDIGKKIVRLDRELLINRISSIDNTTPINLNNIIFIMNILFIKNEDIFLITPTHIIEEFKKD